MKILLSVILLSVGFVTATPSVICKVLFFGRFNFHCQSSRVWRVWRLRDGSG